MAGGRKGYESTKIFFVDFVSFATANAGSRLGGDKISYFRMESSSLLTKKAPISARDSFYPRVVLYLTTNGINPMIRAFLIALASFR